LIDLLLHPHYTLDAVIAVTKVTTRRIERRKLNANFAVPQRPRLREVATVLQRGQMEDGGIRTGLELISISGCPSSTSFM